MTEAQFYNLVSLNQNFKELEKEGKGTYKLREIHETYQPNESMDLL